MIRFCFELCRLLARRKVAVSADEVEPREAITGPSHRSPHGAGWFDSSWDLAHGLDVHEGMPEDAPLHAWLEHALRATPANSVVVTERDEQPGAGLVPASAHGALGDAMQLGDLGLAVAAEVAHLDQFGQFGIDGLELV